jgi:hypothetical protein
MALKEWQIAFNSAKTSESQNVGNTEIISEYESVLKFLGAAPLNVAETNVWNESCRNLFELYSIEGNQEKADFYKNLEKKPETATSNELFEQISLGNF